MQQIQIYYQVLQYPRLHYQHPIIKVKEKEVRVSSDLML